MVPGKKDFILKRDFENLFSIIIRAFVLICNLMSFAIILFLQL